MQRHSRFLTATSIPFALALATLLFAPRVFAEPKDNATRARDVRPNFIIMMADDMGYGDSSVYDGWIKMPAMERMAKQGVVFTDFHSSGAVCSPTRAGLLTGRYQQRAGIPGVVNADPKVADHHRGLQDVEVTFAELLREANYRTAIFGKWHVGYTRPYNPLRHGFERYRGFVSGNIDYISHYDRMETYDWWEGEKLIEEPGYLTHLITKHAVKFIDEHKDEAFCLYIPHGAPHSPIQGPDSPPQRGPNKVKRKKADAPPQKELVRQMMQALDESLGAVLDAVERNQISERTLIVFLSDNGGARHMSCDPLRGKKGSVWEGGHRVPAVMQWPTVIKPGRTDQLAISIDLMPTMLDLAGVKRPQERPLDGVSLVPLLKEGESLGDRTLYWQHGPWLAMRDGPWKLVTRDKNPRDNAQLFHLGRDLSETTNLAEKHSDRVTEMLGKLDAWHADVTGSATPQPGYEQQVKRAR